MTKTTQLKRIGWIDTAKGICMISVIAGHFTQSEIAAGLFGGMVNLRLVLNVVFGFHLSVFFLLSGYTLKPELTTESLSRRFKSLMLPYFCTCAAIIVMDVLNQILLDGQQDMTVITQRIGNYLLRSFMASGTRTSFGSIEVGGHIGSVWFLSALFFSVLTAQLLLRIQGRLPRYISAICLSLLAHISAKFIWLPFSIQSGVFASPLLLLGYDLRHSHILDQIRLRHFLLGLGIFAFGVWAQLTKVYLVTTTVSDLILSTVCTLAGSLCIYWISRKLERSRVLQWIGRNSVYFLCVHCFDSHTMRRHFQMLAGHLGLSYTPTVKLAIRLIFTAAATGLILLIKKLRGRRAPTALTVTPRDRGLDVAKAFLITLMLLGHFPMDRGLRTAIYSFHMAAFVFYSGYCFHPGSKPLGRAILKQLKSTLIPYAAFGAAYILLTHQGTAKELLQVALGMSFSRRLFPEVSSIGPVYFLLLLLITKILYLLLNRLIQSELWKALAVLGLSLLGVALGQLELWLPWSADCALVCLIFYYLGHCFQRYGIMELFCRRNFSYFVLSCIWVYLIHKGGMEVAVRKYGDYGLTVLGAVSGCVLFYMLCRYLSQVWHPRLVNLLCLIGQQTLYILIIHRLLNSRLTRLYTQWLDKGSIGYVLVMTTSQILLGTLLGWLISRCRKGRRRPV